MVSERSPEPTLLEKSIGIKCTSANEIKRRNHNVRRQADQFLDPQIFSKGFVNNKPVFGRKLTLIDRVSQFSTGGQDDYAYAGRHT